MTAWQALAICLTILIAGAAIERAIRARASTPRRPPKTLDRGEHLFGGR
jgi:hypothetical protein